MKVNSFNNRDISFNGFLDNKFLKKGLEFASENGALFAATTTLALSTTARPLAILATPKTDKQNKKVAAAKSLSSTITGYLMTLALSKPFSNSILKIDKNPEKYLNKETISNLKESGKKITESKAYLMATQLFKLGLGLLIAAPKAILTALGTPYILDIFIEEEEKKENLALVKTKSSDISFKGKDNIAKGVGNILNNTTLQKFVKKYKDSNFPMHIVATTDAIATGTFIHQTAKNKKLKEKDKKPLIYNVKHSFNIRN